MRAIRDLSPHFRAASSITTYVTDSNTETRGAKIFFRSFPFAGNIEIHGEAQLRTAFFHTIREFDYERAGAYDISNNGGRVYRSRRTRRMRAAWIFPAAPQDVQIPRLFLSLSSDFQWPCTHPGAVRDGRQLLFRGLEHARPRPRTVYARSCSNGMRECSPRSCNIKISFHWIAGGTAGRCFSTGEIILAYKSIFLWISSRWALLFSQPRRPVSFRRAFQLFRQALRSLTLLCISLLYIFFCPNSGHFRRTVLASYINWLLLPFFAFYPRTYNNKIYF